METHNGDEELTEDARHIEDRARGLIADLTHFEVRAQKQRNVPRLLGDRLSWTTLLALLLAVLFLLMMVMTQVLLRDRGDSDAVPVAEPTSVPARDTDSSPAIESTEVTEVTEVTGPLSGTWTMYTTGSDDKERHAYTIRFIGGDSGVLDILEDDTEFDATYEVTGDTVRFTFTRILTLRDFGDWAETSGFSGSFTEDNMIVGKYLREDWSCVPDRSPPCEYGEQPGEYKARLERED